jgi:hypothetical protein
MILLSGASDGLRLVTSSTANLDVVAGFGDYASGTVTPGRQLTTIGSAATTTIVAAPGASTQRTVRFLTIRNRHASTANTITLQVFDGTTAFEVYKVTLAAGEALVYDEAAGFSYINVQGLPRTAESFGASSPAVSTMNLVVLASDLTNSNGTANTMQDVTGLSFAVVSGETYWFEFYIKYTAAATTTGSRWAINGPTFSSLYYTGQWSLTATSVTINGGNLAYDQPTASNATSAQTTGGNVAWLTGFVTPTANGTVVARFASEVASSAIVAKAGSVCRWVRTL